VFFTFGKRIFVLECPKKESKKFKLGWKRAYFSNKSKKYRCSAQFAIISTALRCLNWDEREHILAITQKSSCNAQFAVISTAITRTSNIIFVLERILFKLSLWLGKNSVQGVMGAKQTYKGFPWDVVLIR